ncbi:signal transduction histidine kinase [Catenulispora sp. GP43]|uniref:HAMP domain-containing sensor histidine kinase n=1 Tax=Catenulispora sp. GP43 TaxID=3156263 RepID=UPI0035194AC2
MRSRLLLLALATGSLILVAFLIPLALLLRSTAAEHASDQAATQAQSVASLVATLDQRQLPLVVDQGGRQMTVFMPDGSVIGHPAPEDAAVSLAATGRSLTAQAPGGREVLVAVAGLPRGTAVVRAFVTNAELQQGVTRSWLILGAVGAGLLAVSAAVAALLAKSITRPLSALVGTADAMAAGDLDVRAADQGAPEIRHVGRALNRLAGRITELLRHERETVADLSHRLRTPLTALRIDVESLPDTEDSQRIVDGLDGLERAVTEIIRTARRTDADPEKAHCDAAAVVAERAAFWAALAEDQDRRMLVDVPPTAVPVGATADDVAVCVDTLLDNVFTHTPEGTLMAVELVATGAGGARLTVADAGPGFPDATAAARRGTGSRPHSTGLGLDIARRVAVGTGGTLVLGASRFGGAAVIAEFGPPAGGAQAVPRHVRRVLRRTERR